MPPTSRRRGVVVTLVALGVVLGIIAIVAWPRLSEIKNVAVAGGNKLYTIPSLSMEPTLQVGDQVAATTSKPLDVKVGDLVVHALPNSTKSAVRRVIAIGPAEVVIDAGSVLVDGKALDEPYLAPDVRTDPGPFADGCTRTSPCSVPAGSFWGMGDNRSNSNDSRFRGPTALDAVEAIVLAIAYPPERAGQPLGIPR